MCQLCSSLVDCSVSSHIQDCVPIVLLSGGLLCQFTHTGLCANCAPLWWTVVSVHTYRIMCQLCSSLVDRNNFVNNYTAVGEKWNTLRNTLFPVDHFYRVISESTNTRLLLLYCIVSLEVMFEVVHDDVVWSRLQSGPVCVWIKCDPTV